MYLAIGVTIGAVAYMSYKNKRKREDVYPNWVGSLTNIQGQSHSFTWRDFKIIDGTEIYCKGNDGQGDYKIKGTINEEGFALFSYNKVVGSIVTEITFLGKVVGPNKIIGKWEKSGEQGTFEISCQSRTYFVERTLKNNPNLFDRYPIAFTSKDQYIVGVGADAAGFYRIVGQLDSSGKKLTFNVVYPGKFTLIVSAKRKGTSTTYQGNWHIFKGGKGDCHITMTDIFENGPMRPNTLQYQQAPQIAPKVPAPKNEYNGVFANTLKPPKAYLTQKQIENAKLVQASATMNYPSPNQTPRESHRPASLGHQFQPSRVPTAPRTPFD